MLYVFVITILTFAQTVAIVLAAVYQDLLNEHLTEFLNSTLSHYGDDRDIRGKWNWKMSKLDCLIFNFTVKHCCPTNAACWSPKQPQIGTLGNGHPS